MMLRNVIFFFFFSANFSAFAQCTPDQSIKLQETWKNYISASETKNPKKIAPFFKFPIRLLGYSDGEKAVVISKQFFMKNYVIMFVDNQVPGNSEFSAQFEILKRDATKQISDASKQRSCAGVNSSKPKVSIGMFELYWSDDSGWQIQDIYYSNNDKENLFYIVRHP
jgi:hypothetical protein